MRLCQEAQETSTVSATSDSVCIAAEFDPLMAFREARQGQ